MLTTVRKLYQLLTAKQKRQLWWLQSAMLISSVSELIGTMSIVPFIALAADPSMVETNKWLAMANDLLGEPEPKMFLVIVGCLFVLMLTLSNALLFAAQYLVSRFSVRLGGEISTLLFGYYLARDVLFHSQTHSASIVQRVFRDAQKISTGLVTPLLRLNARIFSIVLLSGLLVWLSPVIAFSSLVVLVLVYWFIYQVIRGTIYRFGQRMAEQDQERQRILNESLGGIRDVKLYGSELQYYQSYRRATRDSNRLNSNNLILGEFPYYLVETVVFFGMVIVTMYLSTVGTGLESALPVLTLFAMAGFKLIPKLQQCYKSITQMRSSQASFERVYSDLVASKNNQDYEVADSETITPEHSFGLRGVRFRYPGQSRDIFDNFSCEFEVGKITAITGVSGVGKSTLLDILMGLIKPECGGIVVDGTELHHQDMVNWRQRIGYVTQDVHIVDDTLAQNIAFGVDQDDVDMEHVARVVAVADLTDVVQALPEGLNTRVGERGSQLSGGQRQRIGLARALYRGASILLMDEATNALDLETQAGVLDNLRVYMPDGTILMVSHGHEAMSIADACVGLTKPGVLAE